MSRRWRKTPKGRLFVQNWERQSLKCSIATPGVLGARGRGVRGERRIGLHKGLCEVSLTSIGGRHQPTPIVQKIQKRLLGEARKGESDRCGRREE